MVNSPILTETATLTSDASLLAALKPKEIVDQLDKFIIGQAPAKRAVAIALRNRWRRHQLSDAFRNEVIPKNILMIGPTGCGKTEIARRIAKLSQAPFIKVEATKFTEVGFHGKDVDHIIRDLVEISINMTRKRIKDEIKNQVLIAAEEKILDALVGVYSSTEERENWHKLLKSGQLESRTIEIDVPIKQVQSGSTPGLSGADKSASSYMDDLSRLAKAGAKKTERKKLTVTDARPILEESQTDVLLEGFDVTREAIKSVEESGIVFIDEIDKLVNHGDYRGADASSEGVQRDLLPIIEGSVISTKHGNVNTEFILFIASGAFHSVKPSDLIAELQGRLPIRVTLKGLSEDDLFRILTEPVTNLIQQQKELMKAENVDIQFSEGAIREIARVAFETNLTVENIGARRLHTVIEKIVEEISFDASEKAGESVHVTEDYVKERVKDLRSNSDLRKYIL